MDHWELPHHHGDLQAAQTLHDRAADLPRFQQTAQLFHYLSDPTRVRLFWLLCHCEECVLNIAAMVDMSSPAVCHHLKLLKTSGLIVSRREGKEVYYTAAPTRQSKLLHRMLEQVMELPCP